MAILTTFAAVLAFAAVPALASYNYYGQGNYSNSGTQATDNVFILTGDEVDNGTCEGNHVGCGVSLCAYAETNGLVYGGKACNYDQAYHSYSYRGLLRGYFDEYAHKGQYLFGTVFY